jgi:hypothetical protein
MLLMFRFQNIKFSRIWNLTFTGCFLLRYGLRWGDSEIAFIAL